MRLRPLLLAALLALCHRAAAADPPLVGPIRAVEHGTTIAVGPIVATLAGIEPIVADGVVAGLRDQLASQLLLGRTVSCAHLDTADPAAAADCRLQPGGQDPALLLIEAGVATVANQQRPDLFGLVEIYRTASEHARCAGAGLWRDFAARNSVSCQPFMSRISRWIVSTQSPFVPDQIWSAIGSIVAALVALSGVVVSITVGFSVTRYTLRQNLGNQRNEDKRRSLAAKNSMTAALLAELTVAADRVKASLDEKHAALLDYANFPATEPVQADIAAEQCLLPIVDQRVYNANCERIDRLDQSSAEHLVRCYAEFEFYVETNKRLRPNEEITVAAIVSELRWAERRLTELSTLIATTRAAIQPGGIA